ncbi:dynein light chain roadblock-type 1 isoform X1 [Neofelis nebulosa]|uniref:dynein light chain roadblock-type 1 isoform X1 n=1 Tax=Neofelis nebulosa TaxID=61452 RepID=UPI00272B4552|nr:dynein light chain roadblock-type 1 isoform X1 [Neofelis nebulosa]
MGELVVCFKQFLLNPGRGGRDTEATSEPEGSTGNHRGEHRRSHSRQCQEKRNPAAEPTGLHLNPSPTAYLLCDRSKLLLLHWHSHQEHHGQSHHHTVCQPHAQLHLEGPEHRA